MQERELCSGLNIDQNTLEHYLNTCAEYRLAYVDLRTRVDIRGQLQDDVTWAKFMVLNSVLDAADQPVAWERFEALPISAIKSKSLDSLLSTILEGVGSHIWCVCLWLSVYGLVYCFVHVCAEVCVVCVLEHASMHVV